MLILLLLTLFTQTTALSNQQSNYGSITNQLWSNAIDMYKLQVNAGITFTGGFDQSNTSWYVSGIMWYSSLEYSLYSGDKSNDLLTSNALYNATFGSAADLLDGSQASLQETLYGKWNDDIAWWALACTSSIYIYGTNVTLISDNNKNGGNSLNIAILTYNEIWFQWDTQYCNGGIYWSRNRQATNLNQRYYKSTITHAEFILLGSRLYDFTKNITYIQQSITVYSWLKSSNIITSNYTLNDGIMTLNPNVNNLTCQLPTTDQWSYNYGTLISGLSKMFNITNNTTYLSDAQSLAKVALATFVTNNNIISETSCESTNSCVRDISVYKGLFAKGLADLYNIPQINSTIKNLINTVFQSTITAALNNCNNQYFCNNQWIQQVNASNTYNIYEQLPTTQLMSAADQIYNIVNLQNGTFGTNSTSNKKNNSGHRLTFNQTLFIFIFIFLYFNVF